MKYSVLLVGVACSAASDHVQIGVDRRTYRSLEDVYGSVTSAARQAQRSYFSSRTVSGRPSKYLRSIGASAYDEMRKPDNCIFPIDLMILQDATGSFQVDFDSTYAKTLPALANLLPEMHPESTFSLVSFRDKPIGSLGEEDDDCYSVQAIKASDPLDLRGFYAAVHPGGGVDWPENQYGAIMAALKSPMSIPWTKNPLATKVILMITDSPPHFEGDDVQVKHPELTPWGSSYEEALSDEFCTKRYYPSPQVIKETLLEQKVHLATIVVRNEEFDGLGERSWRWFNDFVGYPEAYLQTNLDSLEGWFRQFGAILYEIRQLECGLGTTTPKPSETVDPEEEVERHHHRTREQGEEGLYPQTREDETEADDYRTGETEEHDSRTDEKTEEHDHRTDETEEHDHRTDKTEEHDQRTDHRTEESNQDLTEEVYRDVSRNEHTERIHEATEFEILSTRDEKGNCICLPSHLNCCDEVPELLIAIKKRPKVLDIHLVAEQSEGELY